MKHLFLLLIIFLSIDASAQSAKEKRADKNYNNLSYVKAANIYEELAAHNKLSDVGILHLGNCYRETGRWGLAEQWYGKLANGKTPPAEVIYYYAQALRFNGKYSESQNQMNRFEQIQADDSRAKEFKNNLSFFENQSKQQPYFDLKIIEANSLQADFGASFYGDKVVFASARPNQTGKQNIHTYNGSPFLDMYVANRETNGQLSNISLLNRHIDTKFHEGPACFSADGNTMYFTRNNYFNGKYSKSLKGINNLKIFRAKWNGNSWIEENISINSNEYSVGHPALSADGKWLYFVSDMAGGKGETDIYRVAINSDGSFGNAENIPGAINTEGKEMFPFIDKQGNLFFASDGHLGLGGLDIFYAASDGNGGFSKPMNPGIPINSSSDDFSLVLDGTSKSGYVSSNRIGGKGDDDIYAINLLRPLAVTYSINGIAKEKSTGLLLANASISLLDAEGVLLSNIVTSTDGSFSFEVESSDNYYLKGNLENYFESKTSFNTIDIEQKNKLTQDLLFEKNIGLALHITTLDKSNSTAIDSVKINVIDNLTGNPIQGIETGTIGDFRFPVANKKVGDEISYTITFEKSGYLTQTKTITETVKNSEEIVVSETLDPISVGMDLSKIIQINPIYFDVNKFNIRTDAAKELDKIVNVLNENPTMIIELGSHTDCRGTATANLTLSEKRAKASADYVKKRISNPERIYGKGYGETQLLNGCNCEGTVKSDCTEEEHQKNRRTEFKIIKM